MEVNIGDTVRFVPCRDSIDEGATLSGVVIETGVTMVDGEPPAGSDLPCVMVRTESAGVWACPVAWIFATDSAGVK